MATHIFRITVRGQFDGLTEEQRAALLDELEEHDIFRATWVGGSLTYDANLVAWSYRVEIRQQADSQEEAHDLALAAATEQALELLADRQLASKHVRAAGSAMADIWRDT